MKKISSIVLILGCCARAKDVSDLVFKFAINAKDDKSANYLIGAKENKKAAEKTFHDTFSKNPESLGASVETQWTKKDAKKIDVGGKEVEISKAKTVDKFANLFEKDQLGDKVLVDAEKLAPSTEAKAALEKLATRIKTLSEKTA